MESIDDQIISFKVDTVGLDLAVAFIGTMIRILMVVHG
jgi:hypothetical protein